MNTTESDLELYQLAFTHSSYTKDNAPGEANNERLEFYGDAVLKLVFSKYLYYKFPDKQEGALTAYRSSLISDKMLAKVGHDLGFDGKIKVGKSLASQKIPDSVVGDSVEAYIGAVFIDKGYKEAEEFILQSWKKHIEHAIEESVEENYKARLQEYIQNKHKKPPHYKTIKEDGPAHDRNFTIGVYFEEDFLGQGVGNSKKVASQMAAKDALTKISNN